MLGLFVASSALLQFINLFLTIIKGSYELNLQTIGQHLGNRRIVLWLKQIEVSRILEETEDCITYWENERSQPQIQFYPKIIEFLGYNPYQVEGLAIGAKSEITGLINSFISFSKE